LTQNVKNLAHAQSFSTNEQILEIFEKNSIGLYHLEPLQITKSVIEQENVHKIP